MLNIYDICNICWKCHFKFIHGLEKRGAIKYFFIKQIQIVLNTSETFDDTLYDVNRFE